VPTFLKHLGVAYFPFISSFSISALLSLQQSSFVDRSLDLRPHAQVLPFIVKVLLASVKSR
jgi:hypothetical protein